MEDLGKFRRQFQDGEKEIAVGLEEMSKVEDVIQGARDDLSKEMQELYA